MTRRKRMSPITLSPKEWGTYQKRHALLLVEQLPTGLLVYPIQ